MEMSTEAEMSEMYGSVSVIVNRPAPARATENPPPRTEEAATALDPLGAKLPLMM
jgi:hypothetical protein